MHEDLYIPEWHNDEGENGGDEPPRNLLSKDTEEEEYDDILKEKGDSPNKEFWGRQGVKVSVEMQGLSAEERNKSKGEEIATGEIPGKDLEQLGKRTTTAARQEGKTAAKDRMQSVDEFHHG